MLPTYIYGLHDPILDEIFYVGQSRDPKNRLLTHIAGAREVEKSLRILEILKAGRRPEIRILQEIPDAMAGAEFVRSQEGKWINALGAQLVNRTRWEMPEAYKDFTRMPEEDA